MADYRIEFRKSAEKDLRRVPKSLTARISAAVDSLAVDPRHVGTHRLASDAARFRVRVGDWRILYTIDDQARAVVVHNVKHRREAYR